MPSLPDGYVYQNKKLFPFAHLTLIWHIVFVSVYSTLMCVGFFTYCRPMAGWWDETVEAQCYDITVFQKFGIIYTVFNIFTEVALAVLPIPIILDLQLKLRTRLYLVFILGLGWM
jgi:hypothetical protein